MIQRLDSSKCSTHSPELPKDQVPKIISLNSQAKPVEEKRMSIQEYIESQNNRVVAFLINWIRSTYTKELLGFLMKDFKNQIETDISKKLNK